MKKRLNVGDRMRVRTENRFYGYQPGDKGAVTRGPCSYPSGTVCYLITMDEDTLVEGPIIFLADEIEPDG